MWREEVILIRYEEVQIPHMGVNGPLGKTPMPIGQILGLLKCFKNIQNFKMSASDQPGPHIVVLKFQTNLAETNVAVPQMTIWHWFQRETISNISFSEVYTKGKISEKLFFFLMFRMLLRWAE